MAKAALRRRDPAPERESASEIVLHRAEPRATRYSAERAAVIVSEAHLRRLVSAIRDCCDGAEPVLAIDCKDGLSREFSDFDAFVEYGNPKARAITRVQIKAHSGAGTDQYTSVDVYLGSGKHETLANIDIRISGPESKIEKLSRVLDDTVENMRPMYGPIAKVNTTLLVCGLMMALWPFFAMVLVKKNITLTHGMIILACISIASFVIPWVLGSALNRIRGFIWPMTVFVIGHEEKQEKLRDFIRMGVIFSTILSIATSYMTCGGSGG